ncbi:MAG: type II toxin-antitoxin system prevent-host-death family antitoxin [Chloracidobacterium sp.]|nr:type II toxin-antitoxin system prevent-host-death family antitoxin [Chloracidobacterium sp.]
MKLVVSITEFRRRISFYLAKVKHGETVILTERCSPVAKLIKLTDREVKQAGVDR